MTLKMIQINPSHSEFIIYLRAAARSAGIQTSYKNNEGQTVFAPVKTLAQLCENMTGIFPKNKEDCFNILRKKSELLLKNKVPVSIVAWNGTLKRFHAQLEIEADISKIQFKINNELLNHTVLTTLNRKNRKTLHIQIDTKIPIGYHELVLFVDNQKMAISFVISAPEKLPSKSVHSWGPFIPIYALRSESDWGIGSFSDLASAAKICKKYGASFISILPVLAGRFEDEECDPSPYSSLSRFFWNEIYLDVDLLLSKYPLKTALEIRHSDQFKNLLSELKATKYVDYFKCYQLKKQLLIILADDFFKNPQPLSYYEFLKKNPLAERYAAFRSKNIQEANYHLFVQYETDLALNDLRKNLGVDLYMDYPVGVNDSGFDYAEDPSNFLGSVSVGAPPEPVFQLGQDWGFPAFHPQKLPQKKYSYFIESIRQHLKYSKILRLDHVIGLYRIYSVPKGFGGKNGAYIRFAEEDFFAIVVLEAEKAGADIIGENLGTVPSKVNEILYQRNIKGMQILQLDLWQKPEDLSSRLDQNTLCAINTHDMPMFARFLKGDDLDEVRDLGILGADFYTTFKDERKTQLDKWKNIFQDNPVIYALKFLANSNCRYLVANLEDFWGEEVSQNIPGTWKEVPNWRRKMLLPIEQWEKHDNSLLAFRALEELFSKT